MQVGLFVTCLVDMMRPSIGFAALRLLEEAGCQVVVPSTQTCCGQPGWNSGDRASTRALAEKLLDEFEHCQYVVVPSGSCGGMIRSHYPDVFAGEPAMAARVAKLAAKTYELTDFLVNVAKVYMVPGNFQGTLTYHDSCSGLRELGVKSQPRELLAMMPGATLKEMRDCEACCGFGGTFAIKFGNVSTKIANDKCEAVAESGADTLVLGDLGCMLNIEGRMRTRGDSTKVMHVAEALVAGAEPVQGQAHDGAGH